MHIVSPDDISVTLFARTSALSQPRTIFTVGLEGVHCGPLHGGYPARLEELNFFVGVIDKIRAIRPPGRGLAGAEQELCDVLRTTVNTARQQPATPAISNAATIVDIRGGYL